MMLWVRETPSGSVNNACHLKIGLWKLPPLLSLLVVGWRFSRRLSRLLGDCELHLIYISTTFRLLTKKKHFLNTTITKELLCGVFVRLQSLILQPVKSLNR